MTYKYTTGQTQTLSSIYTYTANVVSYDSVNKIAYLNTPVNISLGYNNVLGKISSQYNFIGTKITNVSQAVKSNTSLPALSTDENGNFVGVFNVPSTTFQTGTKVFRVDNRTVASDPTTSTCYAEATFTASGLSAQTNQANFSPSIDSSSMKFTSVSQTPKTLIKTITTYTPYDPIAQSFIIDPTNFPNGVFLKSIKVFFATKPASNIPVTISIIPTVNGYPNGNALDYSTVTLSADQILTSLSPHFLDPLTYTEFVFKAPVYIQAGVLYAFVLKANSPDYTVYLAEQNSVAIPSTAKPTPTSVNPTAPTKVGAAPYVGALFESQNSITWSADQTKDLMFVIDQCVFDISQTPQINFTLPQGLPFRKLGLDDIQHKIDANTVSNVMGNFTQNMRSDAFNLTTTDFIPTSTSIGYQYTATLANGNVPDGPYGVSPGKYGCPTPTNIQLNDGQGERVLLSTSNSSFTLSALLTSSDKNVSPIISDDGISVFNLRYMINDMGIQNNVIALANTGYAYNVNAFSVTVSSPDIGTDTAILSANLTSNGAISTVYSVYPGSGYLTTPTVTITGANTLNPAYYPASIIISGETSAQGGNSYAKYFTKKVVLTAGNDSGDLRVFYTAYKPVGTGVYVYYKILSSNDSQSFDSGNWQLMTQTTGTVYSSSQSDLIEFECAPGVNGKPYNAISYTNSNGVIYTSFIQFAIKIVLASNDNTNVPFLTDIRALALPSGTGI